MTTMKLQLSLLCVSFLLLASFNPAMTSSSASCVVQSDGCSIPGNLPFVYKRTFTPACHKHDVCYSCGQLHGWTRGQCDHAFKDDMFKLCERYAGRKRFLAAVWKWVKGVVSSKVKRCRAGAHMYYLTVALFGEAYYERVSPQWCKAFCTRRLGDPTKVLRG